MIEGFVGYIWVHAKHAPYLGTFRWFGNDYKRLPGLEDDAEEEKMSSVRIQRVKRAGLPNEELVGTPLYISSENEIEVVWSPDLAKVAIR